MDQHYSDSSSEMSETETKKMTDLADLLWHKVRKRSVSEPRDQDHEFDETIERHVDHGNENNSSEPSPSTSKPKQSQQCQREIRKLLKKADKKGDTKMTEVKSTPSSKFSTPFKSVYQSGIQKDLKGIPRVTEPCITTAQRKKEAKLQKSQWSLGSDKWGSMRMKDLTEERKQDLMVLNMRSTIDPTRHYKHGDVKTPKFFQIGTVQEDHYNFYHDRISKKKRKRTLVEELMADDDFKRRLKKQYNEIKDVKKKGKAVFQGRAPRKIKKKK